MERLLLFTTAVVGIIALIATMVVQYETQQKFQAIEIELDNIRVNIDRAATEARQAIATAEAAGIPIDDGSIDAILALQDRIAALEQGTGGRPATNTLTPDEQAIAAGLEGPSEDCIPIGTRFMVVPGDSYPICHTPAVIRVTEITADTVTVSSAGTIVEAGFGPIRDTPCTLMLFTADVEGFAEMRVTC